MLFDLFLCPACVGVGLESAKSNANGALLFLLGVTVIILSVFCMGFLYLLKKDHELRH